MQGEGQQLSGGRNVRTTKRSPGAVLKLDFVLANPPFNDSNWGGERLRDDVRWKFGVPPVGNANFAWVQHFIHHLAPTGIAGFVLANGSMSSGQSGEGEIRRKIVEADLVDCMIALPGQLFYTTQIPVCLWFLARNKKNGKFRDRRGHTLFMDVRKMGVLVDRIHRELTDEEIARIAGTYHAWRGEKEAGAYADVAGFCKSATGEETIGDIAENPRRGADADEIDPATSYLALEHMPQRSISLDRWEPADGIASNKFRFNRGEILFGKLRPYFHKVGVAPVDGVCSTDILVITPITEAAYGLVLFHVSSAELVAQPCIIRRRSSMCSTRLYAARTLSCDA